ncbi:MAG: endonuclease/exonuclease/phosphatase family protein [Myxococcota bacterium]|jgi:hypothetical protein|nr:endonuclease/exonuclease/phosphatase family protein [Myxococcota bacterium]
MRELTVMAYNIENMRQMFAGDELLPEQRPRAQELAAEIAAAAPHLLGIVEASDRREHHEAFLRLPPLADLGYEILQGQRRRGRQDLVLYYRHPLVPQHVDDAYGYYEDWQEDIDHDGIVEVCGFERRPLEVEFGLAGSEARLRVILVATKSKGVFSVQDLLGHQYRALANRKRLMAQCKKLRRRADDLLARDPGAAFLLFGDFNDDPGLDSYERMMGESGLETVVGSVFEPEKILHDALYHLTAGGKEIWTATYPDKIVDNHLPHRAWLDHILLSPGLLGGDGLLGYQRNSGEIGPEHLPAPGTPAVSDHRSVRCRLTLADSAGEQAPPTE